MRKVVMTGADGGLGSSVLRHLLRIMRSPHDVVLLLDRAPAGDADWLQRCGAQLRRVDFADPATLETAMEGADVVVLVPWGPLAETSFDLQHKGVIDAAERVGARHVFYASMAFGGDAKLQLPKAESLARVMQPHLATESYLASIARPLPIRPSTPPPCPRSSPPPPPSTPSRRTSLPASSHIDVGLTYTVIREAIFTESCPLYLGFMGVEPNPLPQHGDTEVVLVPVDDYNGDGLAVAWASREELGEATAQLVYSYIYEAECFPYVNETIVMSGPEALSLADAARVLGRLILDRPAGLTIKRASIDDYVARYAEAAARYPDVGVGRDRLREWATVYEAIKAGECSAVTSTLEDWLGRTPESFEQTLTKTLRTLTAARDQRPTSTGAQVELGNCTLTTRVEGAVYEG